MRKKSSRENKGSSSVRRRRSRDAQLDFEIEFYEALIKEKPDYVEALICLGDAYTRRGHFRKGLRIDKKLVRLRPDNPVFHYNLACSYSLLRMLEEAGRTLRRSIELGYRDFHFMNEDPDLENLRSSQSYQALVEELTGRKW